MRKIVLSAEGTSLTSDEFAELRETLPRKIKLDNGKVYTNQEDQVAMLGFLLENLGVDMAVKIGDPQIWKDAVARLDTQL